MIFKYKLHTDGEELVLGILEDSLGTGIDVGES